MDPKAPGLQTNHTSTVVPCHLSHPQDTLSIYQPDELGHPVSHGEDLLPIKQRISLPPTLLSFLLMTALSVDESVTRVTAF